MSTHYRLSRLFGAILSICIGTFLILILLAIRGTIHGWYVEEEDSKIFNFACQGDTAKVEQLIKSGSDINYVSENLKWTPLMGASFGGHIDTVAALLRHHPDLKQKDHDGKTALRFAIELKHPDIVRLLQAAGETE